MKIYYKSDFELIETFLDVNEDPIDLSTINFTRLGRMFLLPRKQALHL